MEQVILSKVNNKKPLNKKQWISKDLKLKWYSNAKWWIIPAGIYLLKVKKWKYYNNE